MTQCTGAPAELWLEAYLAGELPEADTVAFEEHYFDCPVCLKRVEAMQAVTEQLRLHPVQAERRAIPWPALGALAAAAVVLVASLLGYQAWRNRVAATAAHSQPAAPSAPAAQAGPQQLADLALPPYAAPRLRGDNENSAFRAGMAAYAKGDCSAAAGKLAQVPAGDADGPAAEFYSGVCLAHLGRLDAAGAALGRVAEDNDSPEQEAARYYLAQIALARGDASLARAELKRVIAMRGDFEQRALSQLGKLDGTAAK